MDLIGTLEVNTAQAETGGLGVGYEVNNSTIETYMTFAIQERSSL